MKKPLDILFIQDEASLAEKLSIELGELGHNVSSCQGAEAALKKTSLYSFELIILDISASGTGGWRLLIKLRELYHTPIIVLSRFNQTRHRIKAYSYGADAFNPKPVQSLELQACINALFRRISFERSSNSAHISEDLEWRIDLQRQDIILDGRLIGLTRKEFSILHTLIGGRGSIMNKTGLYLKALQKTYKPHDRSLDMHISNIRRKCSMFAERLPKIITMSGQGYMIEG